MSTQTNRSNQAGEKAAEVNLLDIFFYLLRFWWLYLLSVGVVLAVALYRNAKQPYVYESSVKIFIKDASQRAMMDTEMLRYARAARLNMDNEHVQLVSRRVLERTLITHRRALGDDHVLTKRRQQVRRFGKGKPGAEQQRQQSGVSAFHDFSFLRAMV